MRFRRSGGLTSKAPSKQQRRGGRGCGVLWLLSAALICGYGVATVVLTHQWSRANADHDVPLRRVQQQQQQQHLGRIGVKLARGKQHAKQAEEGVPSLEASSAETMKQEQRGPRRISGRLTPASTSSDAVAAVAHVDDTMTKQQLEQAPKAAPPPPPPSPPTQHRTRASSGNTRPDLSQGQGFNRTLAVVMMVYKRTLYLERMLAVMRRAVASGQMPRDALLVISHDGHNAEVQATVDSVDFLTVKSIYHPYSCADNPDVFPAANDATVDASIRRDAWATCLKHHWWWMVNTVWDATEETRGIENLFFVEDDMLLAEDFYATLTHLIAVRDALPSCRLHPDPTFVRRLRRKSRSPVLAKRRPGSMPGCFGVGLTPHGEQISPLCFSRAIWERIRANAETFCTFDDYNWDESMRELWYQGMAPTRLVVPHIPGTEHVGKCGGWDNPERNGKIPVDCAKALVDDTRKFEARRRKMAHSLRGRPLWKMGSVRTGKPHGWGGWIHPRDHEHVRAEMAVL